MMGRVLTVPAPLVSPDGALAPTLPQGVDVGAPLVGVQALVEAGVAIHDWSMLAADLGGRRGAGLRRRATPLVALIAPSGFSTVQFDDFSQRHELDALDARGAAIRLTLPAGDEVTARRLADSRRPPLLLVETNTDLDRPALHPVTLLLERADGIEFVNLTLESWARPARTAAQVVAALLPHRPPAPRRLADPLVDLARRALTEAVALGAGHPAHNLAVVEQACDAAGLAAVAGALRRAGATQDMPAVLAAAYLAAETLADLAWTPAMAAA